MCGACAQWGYFLFLAEKGASDIHLHQTSPRPSTNACLCPLPQVKTLWTSQRTFRGRWREDITIQTAVAWLCGAAPARNITEVKPRQRDPHGSQHSLPNPRAHEEPFPFAPEVGPLHSRGGEQDWRGHLALGCSRESTPGRSPRPSPVRTACVVQWRPGPGASRVLGSPPTARG